MLVLFPPVGRVSERHDTVCTCMCVHRCCELWLYTSLCFSIPSLGRLTSALSFSCSSLSNNIWSWTSSSLIWAWGHMGNYTHWPIILKESVLYYYAHIRPELLSFWIFHQWALHVYMYFSCSPPIHSLTHLLTFPSSTSSLSFCCSCIHSTEVSLTDSRPSFRAVMVLTVCTCM